MKRGEYDVEEGVCVYIMRRIPSEDLPEREFNVYGILRCWGDGNEKVWVCMYDPSGIVKVEREGKVSRLSLLSLTRVFLSGTQLSGVTTRCSHTRRTLRKSQAGL